MPNSVIHAQITGEKISVTLTDGLAMGLMPGKNHLINFNLKILPTK
jgi:hypothetical protein